MAGSGKKARGKHRLDKYYFLAKEQGCAAKPTLRARASGSRMSLIGSKVSVSCTRRLESARASLYSGTAGTLPPFTARTTRSDIYAHGAGGECTSACERLGCRIAPPHCYHRVRRAWQSRVATRGDQILQASINSGRAGALPPCHGGACLCPALNRWPLQVPFTSSVQAHPTQ